MAEQIIFRADGISIKPPKKIEGSVSVVMTTGIYQLANLHPAFMWQGEEQMYEITIKKLEKQASEAN